MQNLLFVLDQESTNGTAIQIRLSRLVMSHNLCVRGALALDESVGLFDFFQYILCAWFTVIRRSKTMSPKS